MGAGTDIGRRPVSQPRSSNRTCGFPASGFPTGFVADSRTGFTQRTPKSENTQLSEDSLHRILMGTLRGYLVSPSQEMPYTPSTCSSITLYAFDGLPGPKYAFQPV